MAGPEIRCHDLFRVLMSAGFLSNMRYEGLMVASLATTTENFNSHQQLAAVFKDVNSIILSGLAR